MSRGIDPERTCDVLLGFVDNGTRAGCFMDSVLDMYAHETRKKRPRCLEHHTAAGPYIHDNKARVARYFLEHTDKQWLWMCDTDMKFSADTLSKLLAAAEKHECRILGAAYWNLYNNMTEAKLSWLVLDREHGIRALPFLPESNEPVELAAIGMGCTLIHRDVLEDIADQHGIDPWNTFGADIWLRFTDGTALVAPSVNDFPWAQLQKDGKEFEQGPINPSRCGEDVTLSFRARRVGYISYGLPTVTADHWKPHFVAHGPFESDYQRMVQRAENGASKLIVPHR